jgi:hypothetical protein
MLLGSSLAASKAARASRRSADAAINCSKRDLPHPITLCGSRAPCASDIDGSEGRDITLTLGEHTLSFKGQPYLVHFVLPNFYFHCTTAYDILRHCGVELGKRDFIGAI